MKRLPDPTFDQRLADWLEDDPSTAPREVLATVLAALPSIDQRRRSRAPWRYPLMNRYLLPLAAAVILDDSSPQINDRLEKKRCVRRIRAFRVFRGYSS